MAAAEQRHEIVVCRDFQSVNRSAIETVRRQIAQGPLSVARTVVLLPTMAAVHFFRSQLEAAVGVSSATHLFDDAAKAIALPAITTPSSLLRDLAARRPGGAQPAGPMLRESLIEQAFAAVADETPPPFGLRSGLGRRVLSLHDQLRQNGASIESFTRRALEELEAPDDAGAEKMARQTRFLAAAYAHYCRSLDELQLIDLPAAAESLASDAFPYELALVIGADTLTPLALRSIAAAPGLKRLTVVAAGSAENLPRHLTATLPSRLASPAARSSASVTPPERLSPSPIVARDREESLVDAARILKQIDVPLHRAAIVVPQRLPYLYLAKKVLNDAGLPFQLHDSFPLAAEPFLAAVDLVLELISSDGQRSDALALLRSPYFAFDDVGSAEVAAFDALTLRRHERGGGDRWRRLLDRLSRPPAQPSLPGFETNDASERALAPLRAIHTALKTLRPLTEKHSLADKVRCLRDFLARHVRTRRDAERDQNRARAAVATILESVERNARLLDEETDDFPSFRDRLRRAFETHTFDERQGDGGVSVVDSETAPFGAFDLVILVGINDGDWPARGERNIFYPQWLLREFGWPSDRELLARERQRFELLLGLPKKYVVLLRHQLEDEIPTVVSPFVEDITETISPLAAEPLDAARLRELVVTRSEALRRGLIPPTRPRPATRKPGAVGRGLTVPEPLSPTALELYLRCPFKYFARYLLRLEEEEEVDAMLTPLERGRILHDVLEEGFRQWDRGEEPPRPIEPSTYEEALAIFRAIAVRKIPGEHRAVELARLFGSPGEPGALEWLLRLEMSRGPLSRRLIEHAFQTPLRLEEGPRGVKPWFVQIKGRIDRADIDAEGRLHVLDYKSGRAPEASLALQIPLYAMCLAQDLGAPVADAAYLSFRDRRSVARSDFEGASARLVETFAAIEDGRFTPRPHQDALCFSCGYVGACRKEIEAPR